MSLEGDQDAGRLEELLGRYVERRLRDGAALEPETLCRGSPELVEPLREHVREFERVSRLLAAPEGLAPGRDLLHYRIVDRLGAGGMGQVYLAADTKLGHRVALKVLPPAMASDPERLERFRREARTVAALNHPNVVTLYSVEEAGGVHFLTMELVEGKTLHALVPAGGLEPARILQIAEQLVDALAAAHAQGIVHRDLKPANVMVGADGRLKVLDFGLAKLRGPPAGGEDAGSDRPLTVAGRILGTVPYMSPEQLRGSEVDHRTDLFSFGVILYEMTTGRRPFREESSAELISAILRDTPVPVSELRHGLPRFLDRIVCRCLEKDRRRRFASSAELRADLDEMRREIDSAPSTPAARPAAGEPRLRAWPPPELPDRPYPVLLPCTHPDLLAGRDRDLAELRAALRLPVPIVGLFASSGAGKSSLLAAGLVPALRADGQPVALDRHPDEPGLAGRLLGDLLIAAGDDGFAIADDGQGFVEGLLAVRRLAGTPPVLVLDQLEDLLRPERRHARAVAGVLLAASVRRQPGLDGPLCRWILAYLQECHGLVTSWLGDVLREARSEGHGVDSLPHDLSGPERFQAWPLSPLGMPAPGCTDRAAAAARLFQEAIEKPLELRRDDGTPRYPWRFAGDGAARLASAFGAARAARPKAPLAPQLQVVLAHLLEQAAEPLDAAIADVEVGDEPGALIGEALEEHLVRSLDAAFPAGRTTGAGAGRTRALLALRELAGAGGRRAEGLPAAALARAIGTEGEDVLEKLTTPATRLVVKEEHGDGWRYAFAHDRLAEILVRLVDEEGRHGGLGVDAGLVALRRFVVVNTELYLAGETAQATRGAGAAFPSYRGACRRAPLG